MKSDTRQLLRDVKAATRLGSPGAIDAALDGLLAMPGVATNAPLEESLFDKVLLPIGQDLAALSPELLRSLPGHSLAAGRAVGAVALARQFLDGRALWTVELHKLAADKRPDIRQFLAKALASDAFRAPQKLFELGRAWLQHSEPRLRQVALLCLPALADESVGTTPGQPAYGARILVQLKGLEQDTDPDVRAALVTALTALAQAGQAEAVIKLLTAWSGQPVVNSWVITRTLSGNWAAQFPQPAVAILQALRAKTGLTSDITNAQRALERHGVEVK